MPVKGVDFLFGNYLAGRKSYACVGSFVGSVGLSPPEDISDLEEIVTDFSNVFPACTIVTLIKQRK